VFASACKTGRIADTRNSHAKALQSADALRPFLERIEAFILEQAGVQFDRAAVPGRLAVVA
jgi:hypothetical protein